LVYTAPLLAINPSECYATTNFLERDRWAFAGERGFHDTATLVTLNCDLDHSEFLVSVIREGNGWGKGVLMFRILTKRQTGLWLALCILALVATAHPQQPTKQGDQPAPLPGCESKEIKAGKEKGEQQRFFPAPLATVKEATVSALTALEFEVKKDKGQEIEAHKKRHVGVFVGSGGEKVVLRFEEAEEGGQKGTRVTGETKKGFVGRAGQKSWTNAVLDQTGCMLGKSAT